MSHESRSRTIGFVMAVLIALIGIGVLATGHHTTLRITLGILLLAGGTLITLGTVLNSRRLKSSGQPEHADPE